MTIGPSTWPFNNAYRLTQGFFRFFLLFKKKCYSPLGTRGERCLIKLTV